MNEPKGRRIKPAHLPPETPKLAFVREVDMEFWNFLDKYESMREQGLDSAGNMVEFRQMSWGMAEDLYDRMHPEESSR